MVSIEAAVAPMDTQLTCLCNEEVTDYLCLQLIAKMMAVTVFEMERS